MKITQIIALILVFGFCGKVFAGETWQGALSKMPLDGKVAELNRTNCVPLMLNAFQSNGVVKALIFMPGATDEIYFFRRAHAMLTNSNPSLLDAVIALTNQTFIQVTFQPPLLLLHTTEDSLDRSSTIKNKSTAAKLRRKFVPGSALFNDADWDTVRAAIKKKMSVGLRPWSGTPDSWHFYHDSFAACGVTEWEMLETIALADKTTFTIYWRTVEFKLDERRGVVPDMKNIRLP